MDTLEIYDELLKQYEAIFEFHPQFKEEFIELVSASHSRKEVLKQFIKRMDTIIALGDIDYGLKWLEHLREVGNMYSLHIDVNSTNYRLLFSKTRRGKLFLHMFYEQSGKRTSSYASHIETAKKRRDAIE